MTCSRTAPAVVCLVLLSAVCGFAQTAPSGAKDAAVSGSQFDNLVPASITKPAEPDTPLSFYVEGGKLMVESERGVPTELKSDLRS